MKKEVLVSAVLMMSPASQIHASDIGQAAAIVKQQRQELVDLVFVSKQTDIGEFWEQNAMGEWEPLTFEYHLRFTFIPSDNWYTYDGYGGMEYEAVVEAVTPNGRVLNDFYGHHYVKRMDENTFKMFDCDSTKTCHESFNNIEFHIFETPKGKLMKFKQSSEVETMFVNDVSKEYYQVK